MSNVITHSRFDRPKVHQPHPRKRKGTINFRRAQWHRKYDRMKDQRATEAQETAARRMAQADAREADMLPVYLATGLDPLRVASALRELGIELDFSRTCNAFVLRSADQSRPPCA